MIFDSSTILQAIMSLAINTPHPYHPPTDGSNAQTSTLRINKRITAKPTTFTPLSSTVHRNSQTQEIPTCGPFVVRLALKTTYKLSVPDYTTQCPDGRLSAPELTERGKQVVKHAEVLRSLGGWMVMRVENVVDGRECTVEAAEEAFVEGIRRVSFVDLWRVVLTASGFSQNLAAIGLSSMIKINADDSSEVKECESDN
jgi:hypothetical protein